MEIKFGKKIVEIFKDYLCLDGLPPWWVRPSRDGPVDMIWGRRLVACMKSSRGVDCIDANWSNREGWRCCRPCCNGSWNSVRISRWAMLQARLQQVLQRLNLKSVQVRKSRRVQKRKLFGTYRHLYKIPWFEI